MISVQFTREMRSPETYNPEPVTCSPHESPIAQWLEHPDQTSINWKVVGSIPTGGSEIFPRISSCTYHLFHRVSA